MALERFFFTWKQNLLIQTSKTSEEAAKLLRQGLVEEAEAKIQNTRELMTQTKIIDQVKDDALVKLSQAKVKQPPIEFLTSLIPQVIEEMEISSGQTPGFPEVEEIPKLTPTEQQAYRRIRLASSIDQAVAYSEWAKFVYPKAEDVFKAKDNLHHVKMGLVKKLRTMDLDIKPTPESIRRRSSGMETKYYLTKINPKKL